MTRIGLTLGAALLVLQGCGDREEILLGERMDLREDETSVAVDRAVPLSLPAAVAAQDWTHKAYAPDHDLPHAALAPNPSLRFAASIGSAEDRRHRIFADPVVADGRIFTIDSRARVMAHSLTGQPLWSASVIPVGEADGGATGTGLAVSDGTLYVSTAYGELLALDAATGQRIWVQDLGAAAAGAPTVSGGTVYIVGRDATGWAIDAATGRVQWTETGTPAPTGVAGGAAPAVSDGMVVFPYASRELRGVLSGGTSRWTTSVAGSRAGRVYAGITDISGDPVIDGQTVYAGSPSGRINAFALTSGERLWSAEDGAMSPVVVTGGSVFAVSDQNELIRLDASTGERIWDTPLPLFERNLVGRRKAVFKHYGPVLAGGRLWVASSDARLRAFDPVTGVQVAEVEMPGGATTNPVVAGQTLYVVSEEGQLLAFR